MNCELTRMKIALAYQEIDSDCIYGFPYVLFRVLVRLSRMLETFGSTGVVGPSSRRFRPRSSATSSMPALLRGVPPGTIEESVAFSLFASFDLVSSS